MPALAIVWVCLLVALAGFGIVLVLATPVIAVMKSDEMITIKVSSSEAKDIKEYVKGEW